MSYIVMTPYSYGLYSYSMVSIVMDYIVMAHIVMTYIVMANLVCTDDTIARSHMPLHVTVHA